ncbi:MAG: aminopeptidase P family protein [Jatrophihabitans sp.]|uniref:aminopeptidase P family protein n=1 Tax=Jatrophihabitans sp. TaxID=1932789 RepID=UPI003F8088D0
MSDEPLETPETAAATSDTGTSSSHDIPLPAHLREAFKADWEPAPAMPHPGDPDVAAYAGKRRAALSALTAGRLVVVPAGGLRTRANDTDYAFRAASAFTWLTGETEADTVLVLRPEGSGHEAVLYVPEYAQPGEVRYFTDRAHGAVWVGNVPGLHDTEATLGVRTRPRSALAGDHAPYRDAPADLLAGLDAEIDALLPHADRTRLTRLVDELRLVTDEWELGKLRLACEITARGFADVARELPLVVGRPDLRGERWLEGTFQRRARLEGNDVGYSSIVGSGAHATTLHWWRNHGAVAPGTLLLADMGVETDALYTADVTRTMPVSGEWTPTQLKVYRAVFEAQTAGIGEVRAGNDFLAAHRAAMYVLAEHLHSWGVLPVTADVSCSEDEDRPGAGLPRRSPRPGPSHMLGIAVHDCAAAREEHYRKGTLAAGHVLTVEPGLYFQVNDRTVPDELKGIGVRIEDDIVVTDGDPVNLSGMLPRDPDEIVGWLREVQRTPARP